MSEIEGVSNTEENSSGEVDEVTINKDDTVSYETHRKLLSQRKKDQAQKKELFDQVEAYKKADVVREESKLQEEGEYKKLLDLSRTREQDLETKLSKYQQDFTDSHKIAAVLEKINGSPKNKKILNFIDLNAIAIDPETNVIDDQSVEAEANRFVKEWSEMIAFDKADSPKIPVHSSAPIEGTHAKTSTQDKYNVIKERVRSGTL